MGGAVARPKRRSANPRRHVRRPLRSFVAAFPPVVSALIRPEGTPLRPAGYRAHLNRRTIRGRRYALGHGRRVGAPAHQVLSDRLDGSRGERSDSCRLTLAHRADGCG